MSISDANGENVRRMGLFQVERRSDTAFGSSVIQKLQRRLGICL